jgi:hypothetical protein
MRNAAARLRLAFIPCLAGLALGCNHPSNSEAKPTTAPSAPIVAAPVASTAAYGAAITSKEIVLVADLARDPSQWQGKTVVISGTVTDVCPNMGCWMVIEDAGQRVRVKMGGHSFFVPKDSSGKKARVQGQTQTSGAPPPAHDCQHANKPGEHEECQKGKPGEIAFNATGVELM